LANTLAKKTSSTPRNGCNSTTSSLWSWVPGVRVPSAGIGIGIGIRSLADPLPIDTASDGMGHIAFLLLV
jgi:hypothetical protein